MGVLAWSRRVWGAMRGKSGVEISILPSVFPDSPRDRYDVQEAYYDNNELYAKLASANVGPGRSVRSLRNPVHRVVEFHASHLWPESLDDLPLVSKNPKTAEAARTVLEWGNWNQKKQEAARVLPKLGDLVLKAEDVPGKPRVYPKLVDPRVVSEFVKDERGNAVKVRLDVPLGDDRWHTEVWDKKRNLYLQWEHRRGPEAKEEDLGEGVRKTLSAFSPFVPFVHAAFRGAGDEWGIGACAHALEQINEVNRATSRMHDMFFRHGKPLWQLLRNEAGQGSVSMEDLRPEESGGSPEEIRVGQGDAEETLIRPPGLAKLESLVPNVPYEQARAMVKDQMEELANDLPEIAYYQTREGGDPSGRALQLILAPARKRVEEARANGEAAILKCVKMCLTLAKNKNAFGDEVGDFDRGDFDSLRFEEREVLPVSEIERLEGEDMRLALYERALRVMEPAEARELAGLPEATSVPPSSLPEVPLGQRSRATSANEIVGRVLGGRSAR